MSTVAERVRGVASPIIGDLGLELYDVEHQGRLVRILVDRPGGVDIDSLARLNRLLSRALDHDDVIVGSYTLEVSSPGVERPLRTPDHWLRAVGSAVTLKTVPGTPGERRIQGEVLSADGEGIVLRLAGGEERRVRHDEIARARTVFDWKGESASSHPAPPTSSQKAASR